MRPLNLQEFAEALRVSGAGRERDFADEILELIEIEADVAEPYSDLCYDIASATPKELEKKFTPQQQLERLIDRSHLLEEIEQELEKDGRSGDVDDQVKALIALQEDFRTLLGAPDLCTDEDLVTALEAALERADKAPPALEYDL